MTDDTGSPSGSESNATEVSGDGAPTQTRFRFYEPEGEENKGVNEVKEEKKENTTRFNFYDDTTRKEVAAIEKTLPKPSKNSAENSPANAPLTTTNSDTTDDILRSLQETEDQRLQILNTEPSKPEVIARGSSNAAASTATKQTDPAGDNSDAANPYEHAIKEALDLLRKHRSPPSTPAAEFLESSSGVNVALPAGMLHVDTQSTGSDELRARTPREHDRLLQHRMDDDVGDIVSENNGNSPDLAAVADLTDVYEEHKLKAKQRQERMAQYASRLQEFKSSLPAEAMQQWPHTPNNNSNAEEYVGGSPRENLGVHATIRHVASHNEDSVGLSDLSHSTKEHVEAEVQRGVERVLLAILERANASRGRGESSSVSTGLGSGTSGNPIATVDDALVRAMGDLGLSQTNSSPVSERIGEQPKLRTKTSLETEDTGTSSKRSATSVVDELLAEVEDDELEAGSHNDNRSKPSSDAGPSSYMQGWGAAEEKKLPDSQEPAVEGYDASHEEEQETEELLDTFLRESPNHNAEEAPDEGEGSATEDETLENESCTGGEEESQNCESHLTGVLGPLSQKAGGTTGVVLDIEHDETRSDQSSKAQYMGPFSSVMNYVASALTAEQQEKADLENRPSEDKYSVAEEFDDEATELMRTLCAHLLPFGVDQRSQRLLEAIPEWDESNPNEAGYRIIRLSKSQLRRVERAFESMINGLKQNSEFKLNGVEGLVDERFARELQEAERLLDESEDRGKAVSTTTSGASNEIDLEEAEATCADGSDCHPSFPGVKETGKGEMGDLEFFSLPIIFKSHVTGFEPTKDLVLEPGNVVAGQYLVENELGSAAFSTAYRCIDLSSDGNEGHEEVCLKVIKNTKDFFDQSLDEIKILELLRQTGKVHENHIVEMKCFFYYREHLVIVTELLRQNLFEFGKFIVDNNEEPYFTIPRLAYITRQALISLRFVHSLGLVHSDVKPENILLGSYSRAQIKLIDFGSSCYLTDRQSSYIQSRSYRAPEVVLGLPYSGKIDVWSLGCVVAEMYTGEVTFQNDSIVSMLSRIEAICGPFPRHMIAQGRQSGRFFTKSGLLYELVDEAEKGEGSEAAPGPHDESDHEDGPVVQFDIFQPKKTRLASRLGFEGDLMDNYEPLSRPTTEEDEEQMFTDFIRQLLTIDPDSRPTAEEALQHPWMQFAAALSEEAVKYPSS